jgi:hypothetical protein
MREIQPPDLSDGTITVSLEQFHYLTTEDLVIE